jgi:hypothetical protein
MYATQWDGPMSVSLSGKRNLTRLPSVRPDELCAPLCAQCHAAMTVILGEPEFQNPSLMMATYRCAECGLLERTLILDEAIPVITSRFA